MKAEIITYETTFITNNEKNMISKKIFGFKDRTKKSKYVYIRKGVLGTIKHLKIANKTFIVKFNDGKRIKRILKNLGAKVKSWKIDIKADQLS